MAKATDYPFDQMTSSDFEDLAARVVSVETGRSDYRLFASGRDGGRDAAFGDDILVQAKNYYNTSPETVAPAVKQSIDSFKKHTYSVLYFVTSGRLSAGAEAELKKAFLTECPGKELQIIGGETLGSIVTANETILFDFPALWMRTAKILERFALLGEESYTDSKFQAFLEEKDQLIRTEVVTQIVGHLRETGVCLVLGDAGVGKTTAAQLAIAEYCGYQRVGQRQDDSVELADDSTSTVREPEAKQTFRKICYLSKPSDYWKMRDVKTKKAFFIDDFLGKWILEADRSHTNQESIIDVIDDIQNGQDHCLVITSRGYIYNQFKQKMSIESISAETSKRLGGVTVTLGSLPEREAILASHILAALRRVVSDPANESYQAFKESTLKDRLYEKLLSDEKFNPRAIAAFFRSLKAVDGHTLIKAAEIAGSPQKYLEQSYPAVAEDSKRVDLLRRLLLQEYCTEEELCFALGVSGYEIRNHLMILESPWLGVFAVNEGNGAKDSAHRVGLANPSVREFLSSQFMRNEYDVKKYLDDAVLWGKLNGFLQLWKSYAARATSISSVLISNVIAGLKKAAESRGEFGGEFVLEDLLAFSNSLLFGGNESNNAHVAEVISLVGDLPPEWIRGTSVRITIELCKLAAASDGVQCLYESLVRSGWKFQENFQSWYQVEQAVEWFALDGLENALDSGVVDLNAMTDAAWVEKLGDLWTDFDYSEVPDAERELMDFAEVLEPLGIVDGGGVGVEQDIFDEWDDFRANNPPDPEDYHQSYAKRRSEFATSGDVRGLALQSAFKDFEKSMEA